MKCCVCCGNRPIYSLHLSSITLIQCLPRDVAPLATINRGLFNRIRNDVILLHTLSVDGRGALFRGVVLCGCGMVLAWHEVGSALGLPT